MNPDGIHSPGHFETHSHQGFTWRSSSTARAILTEDQMARAVECFQEECFQDEHGRYQAGPPEHSYPFGDRWVQVRQEPWEAVPTLTLQDEAEDPESS